MSVQVGGGDKKVDVFKNTEETYAPESCEVHAVSSTETNKVETLFPTSQK